VQECGINVKTTQLDIVRGSDAKEDAAEAREANEKREGFGVVETLAPAATFSDKPGLLP
jgi:hypothetical protein